MLQPRIKAERLIKKTYKSDAFGSCYGKAITHANQKINIIHECVNDCIETYDLPEYKKAYFDYHLSYWRYVLQILVEWQMQAIKKGEL